MERSTQLEVSYPNYKMNTVAKQTNKNTLRVRTTTSISTEVLVFGGFMKDVEATKL